MISMVVPRPLPLGLGLAVVLDFPGLGLTLTWGRRTPLTTPRPLNGYPRSCFSNNKKPEWNELHCLFAHDTKKWEVFLILVHDLTIYNSHKIVKLALVYLCCKYLQYIITLWRTKPIYISCSYHRHPHGSPAIPIHWLSHSSSDWSIHPTEHHWSTTHTHGSSSSNRWHPPTHWIHSTPATKIKTSLTSKAVHCYKK